MIFWLRDICRVNLRGFSYNRKPGGSKIKSPDCNVKFYRSRIVHTRSRMEGRGVIVKYSQVVNGTLDEISCSGVHLGHGTVLTHGTLLTDLIKHTNFRPIIQELKTRGYCCLESHTSLNSILKSIKGEIQVITPCDEYPKESSLDSLSPTTFTGCHSNPQSSIGNQNESTQHSDLGSASVAARIHSIIVQSTVSEGLDSLMPSSQGWKLLDEANKLTVDLEKLIMSTFVLVTLCENLVPDARTDNQVYKAASGVLSKTVQASKGQFVYVESSPFGSASPTIFLNSLSHGIISNASPGGAVLLTDARCVVGSEGAPVFVVLGGERHLCGLVISPFCWHRGEWLGLTLLASIGPVLQTVLKTAPSPPPTLNRLQIQHTRKRSCTSGESKTGFTEECLTQGLCLGDVYNSVVCIKSGGGWGSGFVVSKSPGIIITCAHVIYKATDKVVDVLLSDGRRVEGRVLHQTHPLINTHNSHTESKPSSNYTMWDLAVVVTNSPLTHSLKLSSTLPVRGSRVVTVGYGMFPHRILPSPSVSRGVISKVVTLPSTLLKLPPSIANSTQGEANKLNGNVPLEALGNDGCRDKQALDGSNECFKSQPNVRNGLCNDEQKTDGSNNDFNSPPSLRNGLRNKKQELDGSNNDFNSQTKLRNGLCNEEQKTDGNNNDLNSPPSLRNGLSDEQKPYRNNTDHITTRKNVHTEERLTAHKLDGRDLNRNFPDASKNALHPANSQAAIDIRREALKLHLPADAHNGNAAVGQCMSGQGDGDATGRRILGCVGSCRSESFNVPVILQTTCAIYPGGSGGPLLALDPSGGLRVVGMVVCNMQDSDSVTFPHVNLAVPIPIIAPILNAFIETKDESVLKFLDIECPAASNLWALTHPIKSHL